MPNCTLFVDKTYNDTAFLKKLEINGNVATLFRGTKNQPQVIMQRDIAPHEQWLTFISKVRQSVEALVNWLIEKSDILKGRRASSTKWPPVHVYGKIAVPWMALFSICLIWPVSVIAQKTDYNQRVDLIHQNINQYFRDQKSDLYFEIHDKKIKIDTKNEVSYLWPLCALIQAANEMEVLDPSKSYIKPVMKAITQYHSEKASIKGYQAVTIKKKADTFFYDDNEWIAIALMDAYSRTKHKEYLKISKEIFDFILTGEDNGAGGGLYWAKGDFRTKNTCSNGPAILVALQLYKATHKKKYLEKALDIYKWTNEVLQAPSGVFYDCIKLPSLKIDSALYTYNSGTMLQSNALLYEITHDQKYLKEARRIANAAKEQFFVNKQLAYGYWFNVVLLRGFIELHKIDNNKEYLQIFSDDANRIWDEERDRQNFIGRNNNVKRLIDQAAMLEVYSRLAYLGI